MPASTNTKKSAKKSNKSKPKVARTWPIKLLSIVLKLLLVAIMAIALYMIYLDAKVQTRFEGQRWQVPVQVFGYIPEYHVGDTIDVTKLSKTLVLSGYNKVAKALEPGQFAASKKRIDIHVRAFDYGNGLEPARQLSLHLNRNKITKLIVNQEQQRSVRLEPALLDRIVPENKEDRIIVPLEAVPERLLDTLLLVEDRNFYFHHGVSPVGILRALWANIQAGRTVQGGSTLTQQLVKNMFLTRKKTITRKVNEALMALILEYRYSKDQLLEAYVNEVYLGQHYANGIYGFGLAAEFYFGKQVSQLSPEQMATLIGQVKGPSYYDPWRFPERAKQRRDLILGLMFEQHILSKGEFEQAIYMPLSIRKERRLKQQKFPDYLQLVKRELAKVLPAEAQQSGIKVFTGFDIASQHTLANTVKRQLTSLEKQYSQKDLQAAMIVTDIKSAEIRALVGGKALGYAGFNRALNAKRPIGSLIKPIIYLAALERYDEFNFATPLEDKPITLSSEKGQKWQPKNYDGKYRQQVTLLDGLVESLNIPTVNLGMKLGLDKVAEAVHLLGYQDDIYSQPAILLGAINMSPLAVNQLYLPLADHGNLQTAHAINSVIDSKGELLWQYDAVAVPVLSSQASYLIDYALEQVVQRGTAKSLTWRLAKSQVAGKTGTTNDQRDSWFIGFDKKLLVTTWVGKDNNDTMPITGSSGALVLFADFIKKQGVKPRADEVPDGISRTWFSLKDGVALVGQCADSVSYPAITAGVSVKQACQKKLKEKEKSWFERLFGE